MLCRSFSHHGRSATAMACVVLLLNIAVAPCHAFQPTISVQPVCQTGIRSQSTIMKNVASMPTTTKHATTTQLSSHASEVLSLFDNMKTPCSIIAGALIPLGFVVPLDVKPEKDDSPIEKRLRLLYVIIAVLSLSSELCAVMWATVATNQLTEHDFAPAKSVWHLLQRDFALEWSAVNVHFVLGMLGYIAMIGMKAYFAAGKGMLGSSVAGMAMSGLLIMMSVVNRGVAAGGGKPSQRFGASVLALGTKYVGLFLKRATARATFGPLEVLAVGAFAVSLVAGLKAVWNGGTESGVNGDA